MANYKVIDAPQLDADMQSVADSIRSKGGTSALLAWPDGFKAAVDAIYTGIHGRHQPIASGLYIFTASEEVAAQVLGDIESGSRALTAASIGNTIYTSLVINEDRTYVLSGATPFASAAISAMENSYALMDNYIYVGRKSGSSAFTSSARYPIEEGTTISPVYYALSETEEFPEAHKISGLTYELIWPTE